MTDQTETTEPDISDVVERIQVTPPADSDQEEPGNGHTERMSIDESKEVIPSRSDEPQEEPETFPREYVQKLRQEAADARVKAKRVDDLAGRLHTSLVAATGKLADPTDLPFDEAHLDDPEKLNAAIEALLTAKPHLASRKPVGDVGQGIRGNASDNVDLAAILRSRAG